jgi:hypothetical protein
MPPRQKTALRHALSHIRQFSRYILQMPLYDYQVEPLSAVINSIQTRRGHEFLFVFPRQSGKDESIAHLQAYLLNLYQVRGGNIVYGDIADGIGRGLSRLTARLDNPLNRSQWRKYGRPPRRAIGRATTTFLSSHPQAHARGETASLLLIVNELQDQLNSHIQSVFTPMRAAHNATAVYLGTVKTTSDALWLKKQELERKTAQDGLQRVFFVPAAQVVAENAAYGQFLADQVATHGRHHPIIASEYFLEPIDAAGGLFPPRRLALMTGRHPRQRQPQPGRSYIATIDTAGQDEASTDPIAQLDNPGRDYTAVTIFAVESRSEDLPLYTAVDILTDQGSRHFEDIPGRPSLASRINAYLDHWQILHTITDETGVGEGLTSWLRARRGANRVTGYKFTGTSKAQLGSTFLSVIETGRFKYWQEGQQLGDSWWFYRQAEACGYELPPNGRFQSHLKWSVPASHRTDTPTGLQPTHDDRLLSAALVAVADELWRNGTLLIGSGLSVVIDATDPLDYNPDDEW